MSTNRFIGVVVVALAVLASACAKGGALGPTSPSEVVGNSVPPTVVASVAPTITGAMAGSGSEFTVKVNEDFTFAENVFNPQAMGRHIHYQVEANGKGLDYSDAHQRDFDEPQLPSRVGGGGIYRFNSPGDRTWQVSLMETGGNLPNPTTPSASVTVHVVQ